jgi:Putative transposase of IS4/5 family (DUF4096)
MARDQSALTDAQWEQIAPLWPELNASPRGGPKPIPNRAVFEGILWILRSGARWHDLPERFPLPSSCWRRLCREDETRQGHEVAGGGRRPRYACGKPLGIGIPGRGETAGTNAGDGGRAPPRPWTPTEETRTGA